MREATINIDTIPSEDGKKITLVFESETPIHLRQLLRVTAHWIKIHVEKYRIEWDEIAAQPEDAVEELHS